MHKKIPPINYDESWKYILTYMFKMGIKRTKHRNGFD